MSTFANLKAAALALLFSSLAVAAVAQADTHSVAKKGSHTVRDTSKAIGHATVKVTREIGHATRKVAKGIGHASRDAAKGVRKELKPGK